MRGFSRGVVLAFLAACGGSDAAAPDALPTVVALSPEGVRHTYHSVSPDGKRIAYWSPSTDSTGPSQLWVANADMSAPAKLPVTAFYVAPAVWSADGARIAAASNRFSFSDVVSATIATGKVERLTQGRVAFPTAWSRDGRRLSYVATDTDGSFKGYVTSLATVNGSSFVPSESRSYSGVLSPDGSRVVYIVTDGGKTTLWVADSAGGNRRQLTTEGFESLGQYSLNGLSPDGKEVLYESKRTGTTDLWIVGVDGGQPRQLTRNVRNDFGAAWSPDGKWVAFLSDRGKQTDVWLVQAAGGEERRVTNTTDEEVGLTWRGATDLTFGVSWTKNGLWAMDLADGKERRLTPDSVRTNYFLVSPLGTQTFFTIERGGGVRELAVAPIAGGAMRVLVTGDASIDNARWSPDGSKIVYSSDRSGTEDIWVVDVSGGAPRQLVSWPGNERCPAWSGDGSAIFFVSDRETRLGDVWKVVPSGGEPTRVTRIGSVNCIEGRAGVASIVASTFSPRGGQFALERILDDGRAQVVWDRSNILGPVLFPSGDSIAALVEQSDGTMRSMILALSGGRGRVILRPNESVSHASFDGEFLLYESNVDGAPTVNRFNVADGTTRRLTTTKEAEFGAEFTRDGKSVVFIRQVRVDRINSVELRKMLTPGAK